MICPGCSALLQEGVHTCPACGVPLTQALLVLPAVDAEGGSNAPARPGDSAHLEARGPLVAPGQPVALVAREAESDLPDFPRGDQAPPLRVILAGVACAVSLTGAVLYALRPHATATAGAAPAAPAVPATPAASVPRTTPTAPDLARRSADVMLAPEPTADAPADEVPAHGRDGASARPVARTRPVTPVTRAALPVRTPPKREAAGAKPDLAAPAAKTLDDLLK